MASFLSTRLQNHAPLKRGVFFCGFGGATLSVNRVFEAQSARKPVHILAEERVKLACKRQGERIFAKGEYPGCFIFLSIAKAMAYLLSFGRTRKKTQDTASGMHRLTEVGISSKAFMRLCISSAAGCIPFAMMIYHPFKLFIQLLLTRFSPI